MANSNNFNLIVEGIAIPSTLISELVFERKTSHEGKVFLSLTQESYRKLLGACMLLGIELKPTQEEDKNTLE